MQDEPLRRRCATEAARLSAETFVWENEARKYVETFERALMTMSAGAKRVGSEAVSDGSTPP